MKDVFLGSFSAEGILAKAASLTTEPLSLAWGLRKPLRILHETLSQIQIVVLDAPAKESVGPAVAEWVEELNDVANDADDVLDEINYEVVRYTFDKKYVFLLCNGLLVFIVKNSGLAGTSPRESSNLNNNDHVPKSIESGRKAAELEETKVTEAPQAKEEVSNVEMEQTKVREDEILVSEEEEKRVLITVEEEDECCRTNFVLDDHDMYEEEGIEVLSAEELNKKCDDFIRRMKEGIRLEAQQQPITF
ncbi:uncharacterized protein [Pyrus communis]|uniref:uncharacterized protein n=1 Tax=Pyrus communis TaxID=23211 RepID=UPI0035BFFD9F